MHQWFAKCGWNCGWTPQLETSNTNKNFPPWRHRQLSPHYMAKSTKKSTTKQQPSHSLPRSGRATKQGWTNNSASVPSASGQPTSTAQSQSYQATVQTEEEDKAAHGEDIEVIAVGASKPDIPRESSSESGSEASEDELGQWKLKKGYISDTYVSIAERLAKSGPPLYMHFSNQLPLLNMSMAVVAMSSSVLAGAARRLSSGSLTRKIQPPLAICRNMSRAAGERMHWRWLWRLAPQNMLVKLWWKNSKGQEQSLHLSKEKVKGKLLFPTTSTQKLKQSQLCYPVEYCNYIWQLIYGCIQGRNCPLGFWRPVPIQNHQWPRFLEFNEDWPPLILHTTTIYCVMWCVACICKHM